MSGLSFVGEYPGMICNNSPYIDKHSRKLELMNFLHATHLYSDIVVVQVITGPAEAKLALNTETGIALTKQVSGTSPWTSEPHHNIDPSQEGICK
jgi:hypothetical protein